MYRNSYVFNLIKENSFSLKKFKYSGTAFTRENAIKVIRQILHEPIPILGGDVYELRGDLLTPLSDNWSCAMHVNESYEKFCERSKSISIDYISKYPTNENTLFGLVFSHEVNDALEISENDITENAMILDDAWLMCPDCMDAWESSDKKATVICPKCCHSFYNPRFRI